MFCVMNRNQCKNLSFLGGIPNISIDVHDDPCVELVEDQLLSVLQTIFEIDPVSGLPKGDIAYFLSKDGNPQVKAWLESNLLSPRLSPETNPQGITDDLIAEFSRNDDESLTAYQSRLTTLFDGAKKHYVGLRAQFTQSDGRDGR